MQQLAAGTQTHTHAKFGTGPRKALVDCACGRRSTRHGRHPDGRVHCFSQERKWQERPGRWMRSQHGLVKKTTVQRVAVHATFEGQRNVVVLAIYRSWIIRMGHWYKSFISHGRAKIRE
jgi:hypothetical protein